MILLKYKDMSCGVIILINLTCMIQFLQTYYRVLFTRVIIIIL